MTVNYILSEMANQDIEDIVTYIAQENLQAAHKFIDRLYDSFERLVDNPYLGHVREDLTTYPVRFWTFKWHYLIVYKLAKPLQIVRVLSGFRDLANLI